MTCFDWATIMETRGSSVKFRVNSGQGIRHSWALFNLQTVKSTFLANFLISYSIGDFLISLWLRQRVTLAFHLIIFRLRGQTICHHIIREMHILPIYCLKSLLSMIFRGNCWLFFGNFSDGIGWILFYFELCWKLRASPAFLSIAVLILRIIKDYFRCLFEVLGFLVVIIKNCCSAFENSARLLFFSSHWRSINQIRKPCSITLASSRRLLSEKRLQKIYRPFIHVTVWYKIIWTLAATKCIKALRDKILISLILLKISILVWLLVDVYRLLTFIGLLILPIQVVTSLFFRSFRNRTCN